MYNCVYVFGIFLFSIYHKLPGVAPIGGNVFIRRIFATERLPYGILVYKKCVRFDNAICEPITKTVLSLPHRGSRSRSKRNYFDFDCPYTGAPRKDSAIQVYKTKCEAFANRISGQKIILVPSPLHCIRNTINIQYDIDHQQYLRSQKKSNRLDSSSYSFNKPERIQEAARSDRLNNKVMPCNSH